MDDRPHVQFVMGVKNAMPARNISSASCSASCGADGVRTGLEDNIRVSKDRLAASNAELVQLAAATLAAHGRRAATPAEARRLLGLAA